MKNIVKILFIFITVASLSSCLGVKKSSQISNRPMNADMVRLDLKMDDFQLLGEENLNIVYRKYFGIITVIDSINGNPFVRRDTKTVQFGSLTPFDFLVSRAMAPVIEKYSEADFVTPIYTTKQSLLMFGGSKNKLNVRVKIYKFKAVK